MNCRTVWALVLILAAVLSAEIVRRGRPDNARFYKDNVQVFGEEIDGTVKAYWDSTTVMGEYNYKKGLPDGLQKEYFSDGKISAEWNMKAGKRVGEGKEYYQEGAISFHRVLDANGNGIGTEYYKNGLKMRERLYKNGEQVYAGQLNHDIKGKRYKRNAEELFYEAQEYGALGMYGHAIENYEEFLKKYPQHEKAPDVKFLIAFTYHNSLREEDLARQHYAEFIKNYPESPLKVSAEFEMENIGKDIDNMDLFKSKEQ
jgi:antitoxin component YwqK of YwqJK toxin-antitoxin module